MIVACPNCKVRLRTNRNHQIAALLVSCPTCRSKFKIAPINFLFKALIAHEDPQVFEPLRKQIQQLGGLPVFCQNSAAISANLSVADYCVLLLDVAFEGNFPFPLIEKISAAGNNSHKIVLLPSVYNRTAYKKSPASLYGADAYLELHHIGDRLASLLAELFPPIAPQLESATPVITQGEERSLPTVDLIGQADSLAKLLVADILLYHQPQLEEGLASGQLPQLFAEQLAEGRRMLIARLPAAADLPGDFIQRAFDAACQAYSCHSPSI